MRWHVTKVADRGTLDGEMMAREAKRLQRAILDLRGKAAEGLSGVLPRWRGELKRAVRLLPPPEKVGRMCMFELEQVAAKVSEIEGTILKYDAARWGKADG